MRNATLIASAMLFVSTFFAGTVNAQFSNPTKVGDNFWMDYNTAQGNVLKVGFFDRNNDKKVDDVVIVNPESRKYSRLFRDIDTDKKSLALFSFGDEWMQEKIKVRLGDFTYYRVDSQSRSHLAVVVSRKAHAGDLQMYYTKLAGYKMD